MNGSSVYIGLGLGSSGYSRVVNGSGLSSVNVYDLFNGLNSRLNVSLSNSKLSRNVHVDGSRFSLVINDWISGDSLSINWSLNDFSSLNRGLDDSLTDDWLRNDGLGDHRLRDNFPGNYWLRFNSLSLSDGRLAVIYSGGNFVLRLELSSVLPLSLDDLGLSGSDLVLSFAGQSPLSISFNVLSFSVKFSRKGLDSLLLSTINSYVVSCVGGCSGGELCVSSLSK